MHGAVTIKLDRKNPSEFQRSVVHHGRGEVMVEQPRVCDIRGWSLHRRLGTE